VDLQLEGKAAIVTGGSRGIGKAVARELMREGVDVVVTARGREALEAAAAELAAETGRRCVPIVADTSDDGAVAAMVREAIAALGHVDILVNNAARPGGAPATPGIAGVTTEAVWQEMNTKVMGYARCAREVAPHMKERGWGRIINISGLAARLSGNAIGSMRNVAVAALTKNLADELGPHGINVTVVHPGITRTERIGEMLGRGSAPDEVERRLAAANVLGRAIDATDIAAVVVFLASPRSVAINGDAIAAGGGVGRAIHY
jgi:NAD(P)-dependent dehydrogenase (short-subunit alcohol dehydrogenase family)